MNAHRIFAMPFAQVYPLYVQAAQRKSRTKEEADRIICWLTGYAPLGRKRPLEQAVGIATFFAEAPTIHPNAARITGVVCGARVETIEDP